MSRTVFAVIVVSLKVPNTRILSPVFMSERPIVFHALFRKRVDSEVLTVNVFDLWVIVNELSDMEATVPKIIWRCLCCMVVFSIFLRVSLPLKLRSMREPLSVTVLALASSVSPDAPITSASPLIANAFLTFFFMCVFVMDYACSQSHRVIPAYFSYNKVKIAIWIFWHKGKYAKRDILIHTLFGIFLSQMC